MRPRVQAFEQLVKQNKQELLQDEERISQIEIRLEKKQTQKVSDKKKRLSF